MILCKFKTICGIHEAATDIPSTQQLQDNPEGELWTTLHRADEDRRMRREQGRQEPGRPSGCLRALETLPRPEQQGTMPSACARPAAPFGDPLSSPFG